MIYLKTLYLSGSLSFHHHHTIMTRYIRHILPATRWTGILSQRKSDSVYPTFLMEQEKKTQYTNGSFWIRGYSWKDWWFGLKRSKCHVLRKWDTFTESIYRGYRLKWEGEKAQNLIFYCEKTVKENWWVKLTGLYKWWWWLLKMCVSVIMIIQGVKINVHWEFLAAHSSLVLFLILYFPLFLLKHHHCNCNHARIRYEYSWWWREFTQFVLCLFKAREEEYTITIIRISNKRVCFLIMHSSLK